jgi:hypothetical protein
VLRAFGPGSGDRLPWEQRRELYCRFAGTTGASGMRKTFARVGARLFLRDLTAAELSNLTANFGAAGPRASCKWLLTRCVERAGPRMAPFFLTANW